MKRYQLLKEASLSCGQNLRILILIIALSLTSFLSYSQNFYLAENGITCMCPDAAIGESGNVVIEGVNRTFTKRTKEQITPQNAASTCTSGITSMSGLFRDVGAFNEDISTWDVSSVTSMSLMFTNSSFNQPIGGWDVSNVTNMGLTFAGTPFNQPIDSWDVSKTTSLFGMFFGSPFNHPLNSWDVSNVINMTGMFVNSTFNQPIGDWNVSNVSAMASMFEGTPFNQPIGDWDVSNVTIFNEIFSNSSFNQDISNWCVENFVDEPPNFSKDGALSPENKPVWGTCPQEIIISEISQNEDVAGSIIEIRGEGFSETITHVKIGWADALYFEVVSENLIRATIPKIDTGTIEGFNKIGKFDERHIYLSKERKTWQEAQKGARALGGNLLTIDASETNAFVPSVIALNSAWIGYTDSLQEGQWEWISGWKFGYTNWQEGEPNNAQSAAGTEQYVQMINTGEWNDFHSKATLTYLIELAQPNGKVSIITKKKVITSTEEFTLIPDVNPNFFLAENGITCMCPDAEVGEVGTLLIAGVYRTFTKRTREQITAENAATTCTSGITGMRALFRDLAEFNEDISTWDVSRVVNMADMFHGSSFNKPIGDWDVSRVTNMNGMFQGTPFNQPIGNWDVSNVTTMFRLFSKSSFNQSIGNWDVSNVTNMGGIFEESPFNQSIGNWDVSSLLSMFDMFRLSSFNQPIGNWDVSKVTSMFRTFGNSSFNQPIGNWDVSNVTTMLGMFRGTPFNHPIGDWDVSKVETMFYMFRDASAFNQPLENWDVSNVTDMYGMFERTPFNQPIGNWDVSQVRDMGYMFRSSPFNHPIENWNVSSVTRMYAMFLETPFNQFIDNWDVSQVTNMAFMFWKSAFDQPIGNWNVGSVTNMSGMFAGAPFNQPIGAWNVAKVIDMEGMFETSLFNQNISNWCVENIATEPAGFSANAPLSIENKPLWGTCIPPIIIAEITPKQDVAGSVMEIRGEGFSEDITHIKIGWADALDFEVVNENLIRATIPKIDTGSIEGFIKIGKLGDRHIYLSNSRNSTTWQEAQKGARALGGNLLTIDASETNAFIPSVIALNSAWIGYTDSLQEGQWEWISGWKFGYTNWQEGEPNNAQSAAGTEQYVQMINTGEWNDFHSKASLTYLIELAQPNGKVSIITERKVITSTEEFTLLPDINPPQLNSIVGSSTKLSSEDSYTVSVRVEDEQGFLDEVHVVYTGIREGLASQTWESTLNAVSGVQNADTFEGDFELPATAFDELGLLYYVVATDKAGNRFESEKQYAYVEYTAGLPLSYTLPRFGVKAKDYVMLGVPIALNPSTLQETIVKEYGSIDPLVWRMFDVSVTNANELTASSTLNTGEGYWLISAQSKTLNFTGSVPQVRVEDPFEIELSEGWNLISNPYPFAMNWNSVLAKNGDTESVLAPLSYEGNYVEKATLQTFEGAYVFALEGTSLAIPIENLDDNRQDDLLTKPVFAGNNWALDFTIHTESEKSFKLAGLGMHEAAQEAFDSFDMPLVPRLPSFIDLQFTQKRILGIPFMKDVVSPQENYTWELSVASSQPNEKVTLQWATQNPQKGMGLLLIDSETGERIDMLKTREYSFTMTGSRQMRVEYVNLSSNEPISSAFQTFLGVPYPNPTVDKVNIPFSLPVGVHQYTLRLVDMSGREIAVLEQGEKSEGNYLSTHTMSSLSQGVYFIILEVPNNSKGRMTRKLIIR